MTGPFPDIDDVFESEKKRKDFLASLEQNGLCPDCDDLYGNPICEGGPTCSCPCHAWKARHSRQDHPKLRRDTNFALTGKAGKRGLTTSEWEHLLQLPDFRMFTGDWLARFEIWRRSSPPTDPVKIPCDHKYEDDEVKIYIAGQGTDDPTLFVVGKTNPLWAEGPCKGCQHVEVDPEDRPCVACSRNNTYGDWWSGADGSKPKRGISFRSIRVIHCPLCGMFIGRLPDPRPRGDLCPACDNAGTVHLQVAEDTFGICPGHARMILQLIEGSDPQRLRELAQLLTTQAEALEGPVSNFHVRSVGEICPNCDGSGKETIYCQYRVPQGQVDDVPVVISCKVKNALGPLSELCPDCDEKVPKETPCPVCKGEGVVHE